MEMELLLVAHILSGLFLFNLPLNLLHLLAALGVLQPM
jgi:hypothetical protein